MKKPIAKINSSYFLSLIFFSNSGERVLLPTREVLEALDEEYGRFSTAGRKVDLTFKIREAELSNLEFKTHSKPESCLHLQHMKNIRLSRSVMEQLKRHGVQDPRIVFADFEGRFFSVAVKINAAIIFCAHSFMFVSCSS